MLFVLLLVGFVFLVKGADLFVDGSSDIAKYFKIPTVIIGLTIVALGTSAPEIAVSVTAGLKGNGDIAISNILGSNIFNLLVVIGSCGALSPFLIDKNLLKRDYSVVIISTVGLFLMMLNNKISRLEGLVLLVGMVVYLVILLREVLKYRDQLPVSEEDISLWKNVLKSIIGVAGIVVGGNMVVDSASGIAAMFGLSQTLIGLTIVAMGTSLPELATSFVAAKKGESGLAMGNVVGSNIFNILLIGGLASVIHPLSISPLAIIDCIFLVAITIGLYVLMMGKKMFPSKLGIGCLATYVGYMLFVIFR